MSYNSVLTESLAIPASKSSVCDGSGVDSFNHSASGPRGTRIDLGLIRYSTT